MDIFTNAQRKRLIYFSPDILF